MTTSAARFLIPDLCEKQKRTKKKFTCDSLSRIVPRREPTGEHTSSIPLSIAATHANLGRTYFEQNLTQPNALRLRSRR